MLDPVVITAASGVAVLGLTPSGVILLLRHRDYYRWSANLEAYRLRLPGDLDHRAAEAFLSGLGGLQPTGFRRSTTIGAVGLEVTSTGSGISHRLLVARRDHGIVTSQLRAALPNVSLVPDPQYEVAVPTLAGELETPRRHYELRTDQPSAVSSAILASLQPLTGDNREAIVVQVIISPVVSHPPSSPSTGWSESLGFKAPEPTPAEVKSLQRKYARPMFGVTIRLGVTAATPARSRQLLRRLTASFHTVGSAEAHLRRRRISSTATAKALVTRRPPLLSGTPCQLNAGELVALMMLPGSGVSLPGLSLGGARQLAPSAAIPQTGRVIGDSTFSPSRPVAISVAASMTHVHVIGPSGVGKSVLLSHLYAQDAAAGYACVLLDPKTDLANAALDLTPPDRDVIVIDPTDSRPVGLNLFAGGLDDPELTSEEILSVLHRLYAAFWGPRTDDILRHALSTLVQLPGTSFADLVPLLTDANFRRRIVSQVDDRISLGPFWMWFDSLSEAERVNATGPVLNKLRAVVARPRLRRVLGSASSQVDFDSVLADNKIVIAPLSAGLLGEDAASLLGSFIVRGLWGAIQRRVRLPESQRRPAFVFLDEFQAFLNLASPLPEILAQSRSHQVSFTVAHQHLAQLDRETREAVLANTRSRLIFQSPAADAKALAPFVAPHLGPSDLMGLAPYEAAATLTAGGGVTSPVTIHTRPPLAPLGHGAELRERSRQLYGRDAAEIDAELRQRQAELTGGGGAVGRQRRSS